MYKRDIRLLTILGALLFSVTSGVEVTTTYQYYNVSPTRPGNVYDHIVRSSPPSKATYYTSESQLKTLGEYTPTVEFNVAYDVYNYLIVQRCKVAAIDYRLKSHFILPQLDKNDHYDNATRERFDYEFGRIERHENRHEQHWREELEDLKRTVSAIGSKKQDCDALKERVFQLESEALKRLQLKDLTFDCRIYGKKLNLPECNAL